MTLEGCLAGLDAAVAAADILGIATDAAREVRAIAATRLGFPSDVYVLALVGGTGVGKSSLLNAIAGADVSSASARRPTTAEPVAWVPKGGGETLEHLLAWLDVRKVQPHAGDALANVAILDLPDIDSIEPAHRARAEALLPRVDAVAWVTDPEKYHDAVLHDDYLRRWLPRLDRQVLVINKADRLTAEDAERLRRDLGRDIDQWPRASSANGARASTGPPAPRVLVTSALASADATSPGTRELRDWLEEGIDAKQLVRGRLAASVADAVAAIAEAAGLNAQAVVPGTGGAVRARPGDEVAPLVQRSTRARATEAASTELLRLIDLPGVERQMAAAVRARARTRGGGPFGVARGLLDQAAGRPSRVGDPVAYLSRWRERGSVVPAAEAMRRAVTSALPTAPPATRAVLSAASDARMVGDAMVRIVDDVVSRHVERDLMPSSRVWLLLGLLQTVATAAFVGGVVWTVIWILARPPVDSVTVPVLGAVPIPLALLAVGAVAGYLLARLLGVHAGFIARRASRALAADLRTAVQHSVVASAFEALDRLESARRALAHAADAVRTECAGDVTRAGQGSDPGVRPETDRGLPRIPPIPEG